MSVRPAILIVDDDADDRFALEAALEPLGIEVAQAEDGDAALRHLLERDFAVVLMDLVMPKLNGFETAGLIRQREKHRDLPIIILTGYDADGARGLPGYREDLECLSKPIQPDVLRARVAACLGRTAA